MQFLKTLFWVVLAVGLVIFANANWKNVTITLWGGLEADVKLPVLAIASFLIGFLPTFFIYRARLWTLKRRLEGQDRVTVYNAPVAARPREETVPPSPAPVAGEPA